MPVGVDRVLASRLACTLLVLVLVSATLGAFVALDVSGLGGLVLATGGGLVVGIWRERPD